MNGYIHSTESFGTVDGPGVRFVVFMQGCQMRCLYCHNPDTWEFDKGQNMSVSDILDEYDKVKEFLKNGGITVTGGEPLMQIEFVTELFKACKERDIHTCLDTSGVTFSHENETLVQFDKLMQYTDLVMLDIKHIDDDEHIKLTGYSNKNILEFAEYLCKKNVPIWIRHVVVPNITDNENFLHDLGYFIGRLRNLKALDVLPYHDMGKQKYQELGLPYPLENTPALDKQTAIKARDIIMSGLKTYLKDNPVLQ